MRFRIFYHPGELTSDDSKKLRHKSAREFIVAIWEEENKIVTRFGDHDWTVVVYTGSYHGTPRQITAFGFYEDGEFLRQVFSPHLNIGGKLEMFADASRRISELNLDVVGMF
ncbi:hypothetical protein GALMADRAFT_147487 [Galerina marginata CBS 339.88]|uniref:Uncharacterized protein n=1 Tax=Galerina marginata (strain CBS 339.88) TaxID=685588 RepID=A0A067S8C4_GALM3|nr:hypothetical protein GALMADRAFT_147487 [Galerina marginata CBS 339.88]